MQNKVAIGCSTTRTFAHRRRIRGNSTQADHSDHPTCKLGMAAYWLEMLFSVPESNDQNVGYSASVSTNVSGVSSTPGGGPNRSSGSSSNRGGISEKEANPIRASRVVNASELRHRGKRAESRRYSHTSAPAVTMKWAVP